MREAIILALAHPDLRDDPEVYTPTICFTIADRAGETWRLTEGGYLTGPCGRAYDRALESLTADGIVGRSDLDGLVLLHSPPEPGIAAQGAGR